MIELVLVRHGEAGSGSTDHERPLTAHGRTEAATMAARLAEAGFRPDVVLSSSAVRAVQTAEAFARASDARVVRDPDLYGAWSDSLMDAAAAAGRDGAARVVVVAHNPGMSALARTLSNHGIGGMPTCGVARFRWDEDDWDVALALAPDGWEFDAP